MKNTIRNALAITGTAAFLALAAAPPAHAAGSLYDPEGYFCSIDWRWVQSLCA